MVPNNPKQPIAVPRPAFVNKPKNPSPYQRFPPRPPFQPKLSSFPSRFPTKKPDKKSFDSTQKILFIVGGIIFLILIALVIYILIGSGEDGEDTPPECLEDSECSSGEVCRGGECIEENLVYCDEGETRECGIDTGECSIGTESCLEGEWSGICDGEVAPTDEICDSLDNDCDDEIDEDDVCGSGSSSSSSSSGGGEESECFLNNGNCRSSCFSDETEISFNCEDVLDVCCVESEESCQDGEERECGSDVGQCSSGSQTCEGSIWGNCEGSVNPVNETCNGLDDDCDGSIDEGGVCSCSNNQIRECGSNIGACRKGNETCTYGVWGACVGAVNPVNETCNGLDDDCDGVIDESICVCLPSQTRECGIDTGTCSKGVQSCVNNSWSSQCVGSINPATEICDGLDNDCDGGVDEGLQNLTNGSNVGECRSEIKSCINGVMVMLQTRVNPVAEICYDLKDNDCDGFVDDNCPKLNGTLLAQWSFDESSGGIAYDSLGKYPGTLNPPYSRIQGYVGGAYQFSSGGHVHVKPAPIIKDQQFTFEAWIKPNSMNGLTYTETLLDGGAYYGLHSLIFRFHGYSDDCFHALAFSKGGTYTDIASKSCGSYWLDNKWHHVAVTYDNITLRLYIDGLNEASKNATNINFPTANASWDIGTEVPNYPFKGGIDEVKVWDYARKTFDGVAPRVENITPQLVVYYKFDEGTGSIAKDSSGNSINGTIGTTPEWVTGKTGKALRFKNNNANYVSIPADSEIKFKNSNFTLQALIFLEVDPEIYPASSNNLWPVIQKNAQYFLRFEPFADSKNYFVCSTYPFSSNIIPIVQNFDWQVGRWYDVKCTYDGKNVRIYVDGVLMKTEQVVVPGEIAATNIQVGGFTSVDGTFNKFPGSIDEVKIYNYVV
jgi:hypothetical protein